MACVLGITGGIASGKSVFTHLLLRYYPAGIFDCDLSAREILANDPSVQLAVFERFPEAATPEGVDRTRLREIVFSEPRRRRELEALLHPKIRAAWQARAKEAREGKGSLLVDIPLLFETEAQGEFDAVVVVGASEATQVNRLFSLRNMLLETANSIIASQLSLSEKIARADHLIWNESSLPNLESQAKIFAGYLKHRYG